jgi:nucleoid-associated protein YgaU
LSSESIGIKVADGTFYPVLEQDFRGRKRLVVTTVRDNQSNVQIDFYRSASESVEEGGYIGSLLIENVQPAPKGEPEIEVLVGVDESGNLNAEARDQKTGESQRLAVSRTSLAEGQSFAVPDVDLEETVDKELGKSEGLITGETYPIQQQDRRRTYMVRKRSPVLLILFILLGLAVAAGAAWYLYQYLTTVSSAPAASPPAARAPAVPAAQPAPAPAAASPAAAPPAAPPVAAAPAQPTVPVAAPPAAPAPAAPADDGVWYNIKWGDTLWDISAAYYRNPWFYPRIARHPRNNIRNPDRILAGFKLFIPRN